MTNGITSQSKALFWPFPPELTVFAVMNVADDRLLLKQLCCRHVAGACYSPLSATSFGGGGSSGGDESAEDGHSSDGDDRAAAAPSHKKKRRAKSCKSRPTQNQRAAAKHAAGHSR